MTPASDPEAFRPGTLFVISAPSGAGKTTLVNALVRLDSNLRVSVSHTTRARRPGEVDGVAYHFVDEKTFLRMVENGEYLEHARVFDRYYGTSRRWVEDTLAQGNDVILEIDWQGAAQVRGAGLSLVSIFIVPPSIDVLEQRLTKRGDSAATIKRRMRDAQAELSHYREYDYVVFNDDRDEAAREMEAIVSAARLNYALQQPSLDKRIGRMLREADKLN